MSQKTKQPQDQQGVVNALLNEFESLPPQLQIVARFVIDHPHEIGVQTMRSLANEINVHPNSFVRLARHLGFKGYDEMRERFRDFVRGGVGSHTDRVRWLQTMAKQGGSAEIMGQMAYAVLANTEQMYQEQNVKDLDCAVQWMSGVDRVFVLGVGAAYPLAYNFWYVARMIYDHFILIPRHGSLPMDDLMVIGKKDLLFGMTFQPYRTDVINCLRFAREQGARTIGLSDSQASTVYREADLGFYSPTHTPQFFHSNSAVTALLETLCALLVAKGGDKAIQRIEEFSNLRWQSGVYEES